MSCSSPAESSLDTTLEADLEALAPAERLRLGVFRLASRLLGGEPDAEFLASLEESGMVDELIEIARSECDRAVPALEKLRQWLAPASHAAGREDYLRLFFSTRPMPAPPWESVYRSPERLVNQEAAREVLLAYADARLGFEGMTEVPADHIALELAFAAALIAEGVRDPKASDRLRDFERKHLSAWVPAFCDDVERAAWTGLYAGIAVAVSVLVKNGADA